MPRIKKVNINSAGAGVIFGQNIDVTVSATIMFSEVEKNIGLNYHVTIALYEIDDTMDVYSVFPNNNQLFLQRASRGNRDDFLGFSRPKPISAQTGEAEITHEFSVRGQIEPDRVMELKALVVCVPDTATAMKWSATEKINSVAT